MKIKKSQLRKIIREEYRRLHEGCPGDCPDDCPSCKAGKHESHFGSPGAPADLAGLSPEEAFGIGWSQAIEHVRDKLEKLMPSQQASSQDDGEQDHPGQACDEAHPDVSHAEWDSSQESISGE